jgi:hypothetical protein
MREVTPEIARIFKNSGDDAPVTSIRQGKYTKLMHEGVQDLITRDIIALQHIVTNIVKADPKRMKVIINDAEVTLNDAQVSAITRVYIGKVVFEVASTIAHDPSQRSTTTGIGAKERHIRAARAVAFMLMGRTSDKTSIKIDFKDVILAALSTEYNVKGLEEHVTKVVNSIQELKEHIFTLAKNNQDWGLGPVISNKKTPRNTPAESFFVRTLRVKNGGKDIQYYQSDDDEVKHEPLANRRSVLGAMMTASASNSAAVGDYNNDM